MLSDNKIFVNDFISPLRDNGYPFGAKRRYNGVRLYNRALTGQEINAIIQKPRFVFFFDNSFSVLEKY